jgi:hypothetical protein
MRLSWGRRHGGSCFKTFVNQYLLKITVISVLFKPFFEGIAVFLLLSMKKRHFRLVRLFEDVKID